MPRRRSRSRASPKQQEINPPAIIALLEKIGPSILLIHSQSGAFAWPVADQRPDLVKMIVAVEPNGPPVREAQMIGAPDWFGDGTHDKRSGLGEVPLNYDPPLARRARSSISCAKRKPTAPIWCAAGCRRSRRASSRTSQTCRSRSSVSEASYHAPYDHCTVAYLRQAGVRTDLIRLADLGIRGNSHMMMLEKNIGRHRAA